MYKLISLFVGLMLILSCQEAAPLSEDKNKELVLLYMSQGDTPPPTE